MRSKPAKGCLLCDKNSSILRRNNEDATPPNKIKIKKRKQLFLKVVLIPDLLRVLHRNCNQKALLNVGLCSLKHQYRELNRFLWL